MVAWEKVTCDDVTAALAEYASLSAEAILGAAHELATGQRLASGDSEGGKSGAVKVLGQLGFTIAEKNRP